MLTNEQIRALAQTYADTTGETVVLFTYNDGTWGWSPMNGEEDMTDVIAIIRPEEQLQDRQPAKSVPTFESWAGYQNARYTGVLGTDGFGVVWIGRRALLGAVGGSDATRRYQPATVHGMDGCPELR